MSHPRRAAAAQVATRPIGGWTSMGRSARTRRTRAAPIQMLGCTRKGAGQAARLCYLGHAVMENRHGLLVDFLVTTASGTAECAVVPSVMDDVRERRFHPQTVGLDRGYD